MPFAKKKMGFSRPPRLFLRQDEQNAANPLGKTGFYDVEQESITLYTTGRHPKDILRSLAHELQHHTQNCNGEFDSIQNMGEEGYAQNNPQLRAMEYKAYMASMCVRDFEDGLKLQKETIYYEHLQKGDNVSMSTKKWKNQELKSLLSEAWGFKMDLSKLNESKEETLEETEQQTAYLDCMETARTPEAKQKCAQEPYSHHSSMEEQELYGDEQPLKEDSEAEETKHYGEDESADKREEDDLEHHLRGIEHHLSALRKDMRYDEDHIEESINEMGCGDHDHDHGDESDEMMSMDDQSIEALADRAMDAIQAMLTAAGGVDDMMGIEMMDDEPMEEKRRMGRERETNPDGARPMEESKLHALVRETIKELSRGK